MTSGVAWSSYCAVVVLTPGGYYRLVAVGPKVLVQDQRELQMTMHWGHNAHDRGLLQLEGNLVGLVVPQVVDAVALLVVEGLLLTIRPEKIALGVESPRELLHRASELLVQLL